MKKDEVEEEVVDLEKALTEIKPNLEIAEGVDEKKKTAKKKPAVKKESKEKTEKKDEKGE